MKTNNIATASYACVKKFTSLVSLLLLTACQTLTSLPVKIPPHSGQVSVLHSRFDHLLIQKPASYSRLHVYIEGDGIPFPNRFTIAKDPTPAYAIMLHLMQYDQHNSIYLGRPCYFTQSIPELNNAGCNFHYWTDARYSEAVVDSMVAALRSYIAAHPPRGITLIGHSGGGTLATLMAARMPEVDQLVTLAANLDTSAWTHYHLYSPLKNSLNPAQLIINAQQLHYAGARDDNIPPELAKRFLAANHQEMILLLEADHTCCWLRYWPKILQTMDKQIQDKESPP